MEHLQVENSPAQIEPAEPAFVSGAQRVLAGGVRALRIRQPVNISTGMSSPEPMTGSQQLTPCGPAVAWKWPVQRCWPPAPDHRRERSAPSIAPPGRGGAVRWRTRFTLARRRR
ncbi:MAG: hypothetical protein WAM53_03950, partial [Terrimicrobiaceae bacterium]